MGWSAKVANFEGENVIPNSKIRKPNVQMW